MTGVLRSVAINAGSWAVIGLTTSLPLSVASSVAAMVVGLMATFICRSIFRAWLFTQRSKGRFTRPVFIVGANAEAAAVVNLLGGWCRTGGSVGGRNGIGGSWWCRRVWGEIVSGGRWVAGVLSG
jgi:hypothetical protein